MSQVSESQNETRRPMGTLACVVTGFEVVARHPRLIILPLLLDLFLWLGPRLSIAPILQALKAFMAEWMLASDMPSEVSGNYTMIARVLDDLGQGFNLFSVLNPGPLLGLPVLTPARMSALRPFGEQPAIALTSSLLMIGCAALLALLGLGLNALYLREVGRAVIVETGSSLPGPATTLALWWRFVQLWLFLVAVISVFSMGLSFLVTVLGLFSVAIAGLTLTLASSMLLFVLAHLAFTVPGVVQMRRGVLEAIKESLLLTRGDFLGVMFLLGVILVVSQGLDVVWTLPKPDSWATAIGLAGHAFVSTALTASLFVFYQERLAFLEALRQFFAARIGGAHLPSGLER